MVLIGVFFIFGFIGAMKMESKKGAFDDFANNAEYSRYVDGNKVPILSSAIQVGDIIEIKDG